MNPGNLALLILWGVAIGLLMYIQSTKEPKAFDPFEILEIPRDALEKDIKKAYKRLSLLYHPDKVWNPAIDSLYAHGLNPMLP